MYKRYSVKDPLQENRIFLNRVVIIFSFILVLTVGLIVRLVYLQVVGHEHYATLAKDNRIKVVSLPPTRGIIYDRKGRILAENIPSYSLELIPEQVKNLDETLARLKILLNIGEEKIERFKKLKQRSKAFSSVPLLLRMSDEEVARFATVRPFFPGVDIHARLVRHYPYGELTSHVVGYVGRINERELKRLPVAEYRGTHHIGKTGIEKSYESQLHGKAGFAEIETNAQGREVKTVSAVDPLPGTNLFLSLDIDLQKTAYDALENYNGAAVAIDIATGEALVLASRPGFDPNPFVYGISSKAYKALQQSEDQPLFDRVLRGQYPPGSTIKPFIGLAGLEYKVTDYKHKLFCPGFYKLPNVNHRYRDWKTWGHGWVDMDIAITQSCDVYFYDLALALGIDRIHEFLSQFGFGQKTSIDLVGERSGLLPSRQWKRRRKRQPWYPGETLIVGIGQGFMQVTPLQLARATATLANRGKVVTPFLAKKIQTAGSVIEGGHKEGKQIPLNPANLDSIISAMTHVIHGARGTARRLAKGIDYQIAGKTGTAQVFTVKQEEKYNEKDVSKKLRDHALFIAFAPVAAPKIAVAVVVENGGHGGSVAAPIAGKIIRQYLSEQKANDEN